MGSICLAVHGGAGTISKTELTPEKESVYKRDLEYAVETGFNILKNGGTALEATEQAVIILENNPLFNAGRGSVFNSEGKHEMDASIMDGNTLKAGAVSNLKNVKNPIKLARLVMEKTSHVFLQGEGAEKLAKEFNLEFEDNEYFYSQHRYDQWLQAIEEGKVLLDHSDVNKGTVGAVALDQSGNLAAATSTGGMTNKKFGRIGDSAVIGAGNYANNHTCAVSCTGDGEYFIRTVAAHQVSALMEFNKSLKEAADTVIQKTIKDLGGEGGLIALDQTGNIEMVFNTPGMYRASKKNDGDVYSAIYS